MGKKTKKGKGRLDKFYHIAKEQGYRSRASFKLIQLNKKYQFLNNADVVIDLCAAPGGWLQVISQFTPHTSIKIGIDLEKIKPIPGCLTFVEDITTRSCQQLLKDQLQDKRADVVLNDGAPNVGANWNKDAFSQLDLCLQALKLACIVLKQGGVFITKVFRSNDYNSFIWVCNQFFGKVEANKPTASRFSSAEIFVVCQDYLAPDIIDQKLFESVHVFKETEADALKQHLEGEINSLDKIFEKRRKRTGYSDDTLMTMTKTMDFQEFLDRENPFSTFVEYNAITITKEQEEKYYKLVPPPKFFDEYIADILVLGKREVQQILKYRQQILNNLRLKAKKGHSESEISKSKIQEENKQDFDQDSQESQIENQILQAQQREFKQMKKDREKKLAQSAKRLHDVAFGGEQQDEELFDIFEHSKLKNLAYIDIEDPKKQKKYEQQQYSNNFELEENLEQIYENQKLKKQIKTEKQKEATNKRNKNKNFDEEKLRCEQLENEEEEVQPKPSFEIVKEEQNVMDGGMLDNNKWFNRNLFKDIKNGQQDKNFSNPLKKDNNIIEEDTKQTVKQIPKNDEEFSSSGMDEEMEEPKIKSKAKNKKSKKIIDSDQDEDYGDEDQLVESGEEDIFLGDQQLSNSDIYIDKKQQKLSKKLYANNIKIDKNEKFPGELSDDDAYKQQLPKTERELRKEKLKKIRDKIDPKKVQIKNDGFEIVPPKTMEDYNIESLAETLAIAKKMLRKRNQEDIIDSTYNRYATEDQEDLPDWFVEDEKKHNFKHPPVTKEQVAAERERLLAINARAPKKILEAKIRNKKRLEKKLKKIKQKSSQIMESEGLNENIKMRQVARMYKKTIKDNKPEKRYVIGSKSKNTGPVKNKGSRFVKYVDKRLKKDKRSEKRVLNRVKNGVQLSKRRQRVRHKKRKQKS